MYMKYIAMNAYRVVADGGDITTLFLKLQKIYGKITLKQIVNKGKLRLYREIRHDA
jgi:hypothetical protein